MRAAKQAVAVLAAGCLGLMPTLARAGDFGAIALSTGKGAWGYSYNYNNESSAKYRALAECAQYADDCEVYDTFENTCVALAGDDTGNFGWSSGLTADERREQATKECKDDGGDDCKILIEFCTGKAD